MTEHQQNHIPARRKFMREASLLFTGGAAFAFAPNYAFAESDARLDGIAAACHTLFPHDHIPLKHYRACAQGLLDKAGGDATLARTLDGGLAQLNSVYSQPFANLPEEQRTLAMRRLVGGEFFTAVRGHTVVGLYNLPGVWEYFGYQGPSFPHGGYLERGFDDVFWVKDI